MVKPAGNPSHVCASTILHLFKSDVPLQPPESVFWRSELISFIDVLLSESKVDPCIALLALRLLERYHAFLNRTLLVTELYQVLFAAFMVTCKIVHARKRVAWIKIGERILEEGLSVLWLEREFLMNIRWDDEMFEVVDEVWAAHADVKGGGYRDKQMERYIRRQLSSTSSTTSASDEDIQHGSPSRKRPHLTLPRPSVLRSPLKSNGCASRFSQASTTSTNTSELASTIRPSSMRYLNKVLNPVGSRDGGSSQFLDRFPKLRHRVSSIFGVNREG